MAGFDNEPEATLLLIETRRIPGEREIDGAIGGFRKNKGVKNVSLLALISGGYKRLFNV